MAKRYDPIMCMMVDKPDKAQDAEKLHYYQHSYTKKWYVVSPDGKVFKEFNTEAEAKNYVSSKAQDAKAKDKLVKVPDNKLKEFEANLRSAGFKVVSKSDRGMTTHYQVEVNSSKKFSDKAELREWAEKIDAVCDKMDSVAPTTWNIGLTSDGKITAGLDVREMYVKDSAKAKDESEKYAVTMKNSSGKEQHAQGWDLGSIRNWIKDNEKRGYRVTWKNFDSKTIDKAKDSNALDEAIKVCDASTGHKVVVFVENYLRSIGKNNSTGKYDRIVQGVRSLLSQSLLDDEGLKKAAEHEADRLLKKYNL